jgi:hypothetical protein
VFRRLKEADETRPDLGRQNASEDLPVDPTKTTQPTPGFVAAEWSAIESAGASPDQVYEALFERHGRTQPVENQRRHERTAWVTSLTVYVRERRWESPRELRVQTYDISRGGFSFLHTHFLYANTMVYTRFDLLPGQPVVAGVVTNCAYVGKGQHRIGVQFVRTAYEDQ